jgi:hypothetical protein
MKNCRDSVFHVWFNCRNVLGLSISIYCVSLMCECFYQFPSNDDTSVGYCLLFMGWIGIYWDYYAWLANPVLFVSWFYMQKKIKISFVISVVSCAFMLSFLSYKTILARAMPSVMHSLIVGYGAGYWLWLASGVVMLIGNIILLLKDFQDN